MTNHDFIPVTEAAAELNLSVRAVLHRITKGQIEATKLGSGRTSAYMVTRSEIERVKAADSAPAAS